jgi:hypothetical protein
MSANHTPGPWEAVSHLVRTVREENGEGGFLVAECPANVGNRLEDARLIAAAPDLLASLQVMLRDYAAVHDIGDVEMQPAIYQARAAIAKATGETQ